MLPRKDKDKAVGPATPATKYPPENGDFDGRDMNEVAGENGFDLPTWYYGKGQEPPTYISPKTVTKSHDSSTGNCVCEDEGVFVAVASSNTRHTFEWAAAYAKFENPAHFQCFLHTDCGRDFATTYRYFRSIQTGRKIWSPRVRTLLINIKHLLSSCSMVQKLRIDVAPLKDGDKTGWNYTTLVAVLYRHLEAHPLRYTETCKENAPLGSKFVLGHSMEDWHRAYVVWQHYLRVRTDNTKKNKYGFSKAGNLATNEYPLLFLHSEQDPMKELTRLLDDLEIPASLGISEAMNKKLRDTMTRLMREYQGTAELGIGIFPEHLHGMDWVLKRFRPSALPSTTHINPRPLLDRQEATKLWGWLDCQLEPSKYGKRKDQPEWSPLLSPENPRGGHQNVKDSQKSEESKDEVSPRPMLTSFLQAKDLMSLIPDMTGHPEPVHADVTLTIEHKRLAMSDELEKCYQVLARNFVSGPASIPWNKRFRDQDKFYAQKAYSHTMCCLRKRILKICAVDINMTRLIHPVGPITGLYLIPEREAAANQDDVPFMGARDSGASWLWQSTKEKPTRMKSPVSRAAFVQYLTAKSPIFIYIVRTVLSMLRQPTKKEKLLVIVNDVCNQQQLTCILDMLGAPVVNLLPEQSNQERRAAVNAFINEGANHQVLVSSWALVEKEHSLCKACHRGIYVGFPHRLEILMKCCGLLWREDQMNPVEWTILTTAGTQHDKHESMAWTAIRQKLVHQRGWSDYQCALWFEKVAHLLKQDASRYIWSIFDIPIGHYHNQWLLRTMKGLSASVLATQAFLDQEMARKSAMDLVAAAIGHIYWPVSDIKECEIYGLDGSMTWLREHWAASANIAPSEEREGSVLHFLPGWMAVQLENMNCPRPLRWKMIAYVDEVWPVVLGAYFPDMRKRKVQEALQDAIKSSEEASETGPYAEDQNEDEGETPGKSMKPEIGDADTINSTLVPEHINDRPMAADTSITVRAGTSSRRAESPLAQVNIQDHDGDTEMNDVLAGSKLETQREGLAKTPETASATPRKWARDFVDEDEDMNDMEVTTAAAKRAVVDAQTQTEESGGLAKGLDQLSDSYDYDDQSDELESLRRDKERLARELDESTKKLEQAHKLCGKQAIEIEQLKSMKPKVDTKNITQEDIGTPSSLNRVLGNSRVQKRPQSNKSTSRAGTGYRG